MQSRSTIEIKIKLAWWFRPYIHGVVFFCWLCCAEPNWERVMYWTMRAMRVSVKREDA